MAARCLITGAQGFIGRYLTARILREDPHGEVLGIGRSPRRDGFFTHRVSFRGRQVAAAVPREVAAQFDGRFRYVQLSLLETARLAELIHFFKPDFVFHLASGLSSSTEAELIRSNVDGTASLMNAVVRQSDAKPTVIVASSGAVYGAGASLPHVECDRTDPADIYGVMKLASEHIVRLKATRAGSGFVVARIFNVLGPGQAEVHVCGRFAAEIAARPRRSGSWIEVGNLHTTRDFIDVRDVAVALPLLARHGESGSAYNIASGRETTIREVLNLLLDAAGQRQELRPVSTEARDFDVPRHFADIGRVRSLGFTPQYVLPQSLRDVLEYYAACRLPDLRDAADHLSDRA